METVGFLGLRAKHDGQYSLKNFYNLMYDTLRNMGYEVEEMKYRNKIGPDGSTVELEIFWEARRVLDNYARLYIRPKILIVGMQKVQTQVGGKPVTRDSGAVELEIKSFIELDWRNWWEANRVLKGFRQVYDTYFYKSTFDNIKVKLYGDTYALENEMKAFFNMQKLI